MAHKETDIKEIAKSQGLQYAELSHMKEQYIRNCFYKTYKDPAKLRRPLKDFEVVVNSRIIEAFKKRYGADFDPTAKYVKENTNAIAIFGPPGHGKTTIFKEASKEFASLIDLKFIDNLNTQNYLNGEVVLDNYTFLFISQELSGEVSKVSLGLPFKTTGSIKTRQGEDGVVEDKAVNVMQNLMPLRMLMAQHCAGSALLFDDYSNASPSVQNILLSVVEEGRYQDMDYSNSMICLTGNMGAIDKTNTSPISSANYNRAEYYITSDTSEEFIKRTLARTGDKAGDLGLIGFMKSQTDALWEMPKAGSFRSPRSWDKALNAMRKIYHSNNFKLDDKMFLEIQQTLPALIGRDGSQDYLSYLNALIQGADPIAREQIEKGKLGSENIAKFKAKYKDPLKLAHGASMDFPYQYGMCLADNAIVTIREKHEELIKLKENEDIQIILEKKRNGFSNVDSILIKEGGSKDKKLTAEENKKLDAYYEKCIGSTMSNLLLGFCNKQYPEVPEVSENGIIGITFKHLIDKMESQMKDWCDQAKDSNNDHTIIYRAPMSLKQVILRTALKDRMYEDKVSKEPKERFNDRIKDDLISAVSKAKQLAMQGEKTTRKTTKRV